MSSEIDFTTQPHDALTLARELLTDVVRESCHGFGPAAARNYLECVSRELTRRVTVTDHLEGLSDTQGTSRR